MAEDRNLLIAKARQLYWAVKLAYRESYFPYTRMGIKKRVIFIHIPKAAGTAVRLALGEEKTGRRHLPWWVYQQASPQKYDEFFKFAFVRNPISRTLSAYNYLKSGGNRMEDLAVAEYLSKYRSFSEFLDRELLEGSMIYHQIFRPQTSYICDWRGDIKVDFVGKVETMEKDFNYIARLIGLGEDHQIRVINSSEQAPEEISRADKEKIFQVYENDFKLLGYDLES